MITVDYKILFEVRVLHDYYLYGADPLGTGGEAKSFFAMDTPAQSARLQALLRSGRYDMRGELDFVVGSAGRAAFGDFRLRMITTPTGFYVGMEVQPAKPATPPGRFRPAIAPAKDTVLTFGLAFLNPSFGAISNVRLDRDADSLYYFSNTGRHDGLSLSRPVESLAAGQRYRMGDLARVGNVLRQAVEDNNGEARSWVPVVGSAFVNQGDRSLDPATPWLQDWLRTVPPPASQIKGIIQIALQSGNGDLSPLTDEGLLATRYVPGQARPVYPVFELRFLSLSTYWRFRKIGGFSAAEADLIQQNAGALLDRVGGDFVTKKPRFLARELPPFVSPQNAFRMPNAMPGTLRAASGRLYSDVQIDHVSKP